jgi:hypothetical protein
MGSVCPTSAGKRHRIRVEAYPSAGSRLALIQLIGPHGGVLAERRDFSGGVLEFELSGSDQAGYVLARAFGPGDDPEAAPDQIRQAAITNPVYLHPVGFHLTNVETSCTLHVPAGSRWIGGTIEFQHVDGRRIEAENIVPGTIRITLPADARIVLRKPGQAESTFSIAMENADVEKLLSYLTLGQFRDDYPNLRQGEVPPGAFHLDQLRRALANFDYTLD